LVATIVITAEPIGDASAAFLRPVPADGHLTPTVCGQILGSLKHLASGVIKKTPTRCPCVRPGRVPSRYELSGPLRRSFYPER
jgi:hypothetical protein